MWYQWSRKTNWNNLKTMYEHQWLLQGNQFYTICTQLPQERQYKYQQQKEENKLSKIKQKSHTTWRIQWEHAASKQQSTNGTVYDIFYRY